LALGQLATLRFSAFNLRTTPEINGIVTRISADIAADQRSGGTFYVVRINMRAEELARLNGLKLVPGMPVEAFMQTTNRTVISYLVKPLHDQIAKTFRER
jgi:HlyD family secretion protein